MNRTVCACGQSVLNAIISNVIDRASMHLPAPVGLFLLNTARRVGEICSNEQAKNKRENRQNERVALNIFMAIIRALISLYSQQLISIRLPLSLSPSISSAWLRSRRAGDREEMKHAQKSRRGWHSTISGSPANRFVFLLSGCWFTCCIKSDSGRHWNLMRMFCSFPHQTRLLHDAITDENESVSIVCLFVCCIRCSSFPLV